MLVSVQGFYVIFRFALQLFGKCSESVLLGKCVKRGAMQNGGDGLNGMQISNF